MKRIRPAPMGRAFRVVKRTAHLTVRVAERPVVIAAVPAEGAAPKRGPKAKSGAPSGEAKTSARKKAAPAKKSAAAKKDRE